MPQKYFIWFRLTLLFSSLGINAQTTLFPGDIIVFSWGSDMNACGVTPLSDELSFMCFQDLTTGTEIDITDNGWEYQHPGFFGDSEGTLKMTRTGGTIARGTVITIQSQFIAGNWIYRTISPDNGWTFTNTNVPGGFFNIEPGGDQVFFMQGGTWDNQGGGANKARYDGRLIWGANSKGDWTADGTVNSSNLPPALNPCYSQAMSSGSGANTAYIRFAGDVSPGDHFEWIERVQNVPDWNAFSTCTDYNSWPNNYLGQVFTITDEFSIGCWICDGCNPHEDALIINVPWDGAYNVVYTNGVDTFELFDLSGTSGYGLTVTEDVAIG